MLSRGFNRLGLLLLLDGFLYFFLNRLLLNDGLGLLRFERGFQVCTAVGAETDTARKLLAATVAKPGNIMIDGFHAGSVPIGCVGIIAHRKAVAIITAHGKTLGTHDLTVMYHKLLLGYR